MSFSDRAKKHLYRFDAVLAGFGKMKPWWLQLGEHDDLQKRVLETFRLKDTITTVDSEIDDWIDGINIRWTKTPGR